MKVAEAMQEVKLAVRKINDQKDFIARNFRREDWRIDPFSKSGSTQAEQVQSALQSISDLEKRIVVLRNQINIANQRVSITVEGTTMTVAEWLIFRREVLPMRKERATLYAGWMRETYGTQIRTRAPLTPDVGTQWQWVVSISEDQLMRELSALANIEEKLDAQLSISNSVTDITDTE